MAVSIRKLCFLVAEDSAAMRQVLVAQLQEMGANKVLVASNGRDALNTMLKNSVDVLISDFNMPSMDGLALIKAVRAEPLIAHIPILMITSENSGARLKEVVTSGVTQLLMKPYTMKQLEIKVVATLRHVRHKASDAEQEEE